jgi:hypothetical protein
VTITRTLQWFAISPRLESRCTGPLLRWSVTPLGPEPRYTRFLYCLSLAASKLEPLFRGALFRVTPGRFPARAAGSLAFLAHLLAAPLHFFFLFWRSNQGADFLYQHLKIPRPFNTWDSSSHLARVSPVLHRPGCCSVTPCGTSEHEGSVLLELL